MRKETNKIRLATKVLMATVASMGLLNMSTAEKAEAGANKYHYRSMATQRARAVHQKSRAERRAGAVVMQLRDGATPAELAALKQISNKFGLKIERKLLKGRAARLRMRAQSAIGQEEAVIAQMQQTGAVKFAEPDYKVYPASMTNDSYIEAQWHHTKLASDLAWKLTKGKSSVKVAICDSGFDLNHPDLKANLVLPGYNTVKDNNEITNSHTHGTQTAGIIAAVGDNSEGIAGMAWQIGLMPIQISDSPDGGSTYSDIAECIRYAADQGAKVVNISYDYLYTSSIVDEAAQYMRERGGLVVVAAGNGGGDISANGNSPNLLVIGATDQNDAPTYFTNFGSAVDLLAPGQDIFTTSPEGSYGGATGSSFSAPLVSGTAALIFALKAEFTAAEVEGFLINTTTTVLPGPSPDMSFAGGRLDAGAAVGRAFASLPQIPDDGATGNPPDNGGENPTTDPVDPVEPPQEQPSYQNPNCNKGWKHDIKNWAKRALNGFNWKQFMKRFKR